MENNSTIGRVFNRALTYIEYRNHIDKLLLVGKTTGINQTKELVEFTKLNIHRMNRMDKTIHLRDNILQQIQTIDRPMLWLVIGDAWCGDSAEIIPIINNMAKASNGYISLKIESRDSYPGLIQSYSNGGKSIPLLLVINQDSMEVMCTWGPRPKPTQEIMLKWKMGEGNISKDEFHKELHIWYARNKGETIISELLNLLQKCEKKHREVSLLDG